MMECNVVSDVGSGSLLRKRLLFLFLLWDDVGWLGIDLRVGSVSPPAFPSSVRCVPFCLAVGLLAYRFIEGVMCLFGHLFILP